MSGPIPALAGWSIASPLCIGQHFVGRCDISNVMPDETIVLSCDMLLLVHLEDNANMQDAIEIPTMVTRFLNAIRVICKQPEIPRSVVAYTPAHEIDDVVISDDLPRTTQQSLFRRYILESALTFDHLHPASDAVANETVPVHGELANDAAEAAISSNFRSAIIFAAAAIESCAGSVLDEEYKRRLNEPQHGPEHRFVTIQVNRNNSVTKDPIYLSLRNGAGDGGSRFLTLLHECPLYLLGRSLKIDDQELYRKSHSLYRTRNNLAHTGTIEAQQTGLLTVDFNGAMEAIDVANQVLMWFGESGTSLPNSDMVEITATDNT